MAKVIGIIGSRQRDTPKDYVAIRNAVLEIYTKGDRFVSGGCPKGGDRFAQMIARDLGATITIHYPDWNTYRKRAGFVRNALIADETDTLIACVAPDRKGGTEHTIALFEERTRERAILV